MVGRPYPEEYRRRVLEEVAAGNSRRGAARRFKVGASSAIRWQKQLEESGSAAPASRPRKSRSPLEAHAAWLLALIAAEPDLSLAELAQRIETELRLKTSTSAMDRFVQRHDLSFKKKTLRAAEQERADVAAAREAWKASQASLDIDKLVFVDGPQDGASTTMVRLRGRCRRGERLLAKAPWGHWKTTTFVAGPRHDGLIAPFILDGPMTGDAFLVYLETSLIPALRPGAIVIMDNLPAHKVEGVRKRITEVGAELRLLPAYSPDLNPIEMAFSQLKAHLRKAAEHIIPALWDRIGQCLNQITPQICANYFADAGYAPC